MPGPRPLLFLDVDGPLIPFGAGPYPTFGSPSAANPLVARINPAHGRRPAALPCDVVWATTWMADANDVVAPRLGLPELPVVVWPEPAEAHERDDRARPHWKTSALVDWAAGRSFAWVDDELTDTDRAWVAANHRGHALLHRADPRTGLTEADFVALEEWLWRVRAVAPGRRATS
ncbi:hypothetical protein IOD16_04950 [Saccharothrix sp. 6-C]|uniref:HAD domain-containing protein n=1 Tax=Saccharothrix sp. 6-C TaxID=2781735 RepID=UPI001917A31A|nr:HAD domain-containing protein [Saccharothrix sp. 6-C]QQQ77849.1 hypothetical protein IOD16_04950 [Saccharothrix sp. 6-C]